MPKVNKEEGVEVKQEASQELKPFFFSREGETIYATSQEAAQKIIESRKN